MNRKFINSLKRTGTKKMIPGLALKLKEMKKYLFIITIILMYIPLHSQTICVQAGPSFSQLNFSITGATNFLYENRIIATNAQVGMEYLNKKHFNLSSYFGYIIKGGADSLWHGDLNSFVGEMQYDKALLTYLTVNTGINFKWPLSKVIMPNISASPRLDYLVSWNDEAFFVDHSSIRDHFNKIIYGVNMGIGIDFIFGKFGLGIVFTNYFNFNKMINETAKHPSIVVSDYTRVLNIKTCYRF